MSLPKLGGICRCHGDERDMEIAVALSEELSESALKGAFPVDTPLPRLVQRRIQMHAVGLE